MALKLNKLQVGPWPMNMYIVTCEQAGKCAIIDPGADAEKILQAVKDAQVEVILITHGHGDHVGALKEVKEATAAPVYYHPAEADKIKTPSGRTISDGDLIPLGEYNLKAIHVPGHTSGQVCFDLGDGRIIVGDTVFVGGPGRTWSPEDFAITMKNMREIVFAWPDDTRFFPGHGPSGRIGDERPAFEAFLEKGWPDDLEGDVTWA